ncbi:hypothetical protein ACFYYS_18330 [Streptomyces sp. NPDC002120]|uniref:hypothetical protein n=1 Tax=Streptomyces sp. NPDC002120 TaxID=3364631 RepID=UPI0036C018EC
MSTAMVAIVISSASALFTGMNMVLSLATYLRAKPRLIVHPVLRSAMWKVGEPMTRISATLYLQNKGQNVLHLTDEAGVEMRPAEALRRRGLLRRSGRVSAYRYIYSQVEAGSDFSGEVPAMSGVAWKVSFSMPQPQTEDEKRKWIEEDWHARVQVLTSDSRRLHSEWFKVEAHFVVGSDFGLGTGRPTC